MRSQKRAKKLKLNRSDSKSSFASMYTKSQKTGLSEGSASGKSSANGDSDAEGDDNDAGDAQTMATEAAMSDPVIHAFSTFFDDIKEQIDSVAEQKLYSLEIQQRLKKSGGR